VRPSLPVLEPVTKGILLALVVIGGVTVGTVFLLGSVPPPSPELLRTLSTIGIGLVLAYVIEAVWLSRQVDVNDEHDEHEE
jgi:xanthosine utilization system XapX-like protein